MHADTVAATGQFPTFDSSDFAGEGVFHFDLARLQDRQDIPRRFAHRHGYYHLLWMSRAQGRHMLDFEHYAVRDRSVFFLAPGQLHAWSSSVPPAGFAMNISTAFFAQMFPRADDIARFPFFHLGGGVPVIYLSQAEHDALLPLLREIEHEMATRQAGRFDVVRSYLLILLTRLRRLHARDACPAHSGPAYALARRFALLLEAHYLDYRAIGQYAQALNVSERQLNEAVKRATGRTVSQSVQARIALEAKRLLCNTEAGVAGIAYQLNFEDPAYFSRFFRKHTGLAPGEFRRRQSQLQA
ncbi:helix-turn-helix transcriptional regulator [Orrella sp. JC864]|uniref:AraC family transcriptional regulator n=1 Tax=Orrella sp. JC864 TaxID=3120298 RepID=UPI0030089FD7